MISLGMANGLNAALHFVIPVALVRLLTVDAFGDYRLLWLAASSAMIFAPLGMPRSLQYFLPRHNEAERRVFINQTFLFMLVTASLAALCFLPFSPLLPLAMKQLVTTNGYLVSLFVFFWVVASMIDVLPGALEKHGHQAIFISSFALVQTAGILVTAWYFRDAESVIGFLVGFAVFKYSVLLVFRYRQTGTLAIRVSRELFIRQLRHALPFGINGMLYQGRTVTEQWIVAIMFTSGQFAVFSVAASIYTLLNVIKNSVNFVTVPQMSRLQSQGKNDKIIELNNKGNIAVSFLLYPVLAFLLVNADPVVEFLYTGNYSGAANVMRLYACSMFIMAIEISSILIVYQQGQYVMRTSFLMILATIVVGIAGAKFIGLVGVAFGGLAAIMVGAIRNYARVLQIMGASLRKIQHWNTIGVIVLAAIGGNICARWIIISLLADHAAFIQLSATLVLTFVLYAGLLVLFRHGWLFAQFWRGRG
jgi:O-antigen/teichoic acid export membrane protein